MTSAPKRFVMLSAAVIAVAGLAACSSSKSSTPAASSSTAPQYGGTLHIVAAAGPDHIDTVSAYYTADYLLKRAYTRQLVHYPNVPYASTSAPGGASDTT